MTIELDLSIHKSLLAVCFSFLTCNIYSATLQTVINPFTGNLDYINDFSSQTAGSLYISSLTVYGTVTTSSGFVGDGSRLLNISTGGLSATGTAGNTTFLRGDNTWGTPAGGGGGGSASLEVFGNGATSSPTATIAFPSPFIVTIPATSSPTISVDYSSFTMQGASIKAIALDVANATNTPRTTILPLPSGDTTYAKALDVSAATATPRTTILPLPKGDTTYAIAADVATSTSSIIGRADANAITTGSIVGRANAAAITTTSLVNDTSSWLHINAAPQVKVGPLQVTSFTSVGDLSCSSCNMASPRSTGTSILQDIAYNTTDYYAISYPSFVTISTALASSNLSNFSTQPGFGHCSFDGGISSANFAIFKVSLPPSSIVYSTPSLQYAYTVSTGADQNSHIFGISLATIASGGGYNPANLVYYSTVVFTLTGSSSAISVKTLTTPLDLTGWNQYIGTGGAEVYIKVFSLGGSSDCRRWWESGLLGWKRRT